MKNLIGIIYQPKKVFEKIVNNKGGWISAIIVIVLLLFIIAIFNSGVSEQIMNKSKIFQRFSSDQIATIKATAHKMKYIGMAISSILFVFKIILLGLLLFGGTLLFKGKAKFGQIMSVLVYSYIVIVLGDCVNLFAMYMRGLDAIKSTNDINLIGINVFFNCDNISNALYTFYSQINLFQVWFISLLIIGLTLVAKIEIWKSTILVLVYWLIITALPILLAYVSEMVVRNAGVM